MDALDRAVEIIAHPETEVFGHSDGVTLVMGRYCECVATFLDVGIYPLDGDAVIYERFTARKEV